MSQFDKNYDGIVDRDERIERSKSKQWEQNLGLSNEHDTRHFRRGARASVADRTSADIAEHNDWRKGYDMMKTADDTNIQTSLSLEARRKERQNRRMDFQRVLGRASADTKESIEKTGIKLQYELKRDESTNVKADITLDVKTLFMQMDLDGSGSLDKSELKMLAMQARSALPRSWDTSQGPSQTRMRQCAC